MPLCVATKGVPLANTGCQCPQCSLSLCVMLKVPGSAVSVNYVSGSAVTALRKMFLSGSLKAGSRVLIVDDSLRRRRKLIRDDFSCVKFDSELAG